MNALLIIIFLSLLFWGLYQKWDEKRLVYIEFPVRTTIYFLFSSLAIVAIYPSLAKVFWPDWLSVSFFAIVVTLTFFLYKILKSLFVGPPNTIAKDHDYWKLLDKRFICPKLAEITFQQTFFAAVSLIIIEKYGSSLATIVSMCLSFIMAHIPLFFLQGRKIGQTYLLWSIVGSPVFSIILLVTGSLWYSISVHMLFYTLLSMFAWLFTGTRYSDSELGTAS